jgi:1,2-diacylglycerol 3-beta-glucosyltransferase
MDLLRVLLFSVIAIDLLFLPHFLYLALVTMAALRTRFRAGPPGIRGHRFQIVIPAHDEEAGIARTVRGCLAIAYPRELFEVVVIADNCQDRTAELARDAGAIVIQRDDPEHRSKGHALRFYFERLVSSGRVDELDAVVVIDADSQADPNLLSELSRLLAEGHDWIQVYDTVANPDESWRTRLMTYSFSLINGTFLLGQVALGLSGGFRGNGMCLSTRGLKRFPWRSFGLAEDFDHSWRLRLAGERIAFTSQTAVRALMLSRGGGAAASQRRRWEFGRREVSRRALGPLLRTTRLPLREKLAGLLELTMPTMAGLGMLCGVSILLSASLLASGSAAVSPHWMNLLLALTLTSSICLALYGLSPFLLFGLSWRILSSLFYFPFYALWKYALLLGGPPNRWVRTGRQDVLA